MIQYPDHKAFIQRCFELARNGNGNVAPNPMVGSVIVLENRIIGEGYHQKFGGAHAEVNAINSVKDKDLLQQSTLYVNLEPCSHYGKTPPCSDLIIQYGIPRVVISNVDPNEQVKGKGVGKLEWAGVDLITGILEEEGEILNRRFFTFHRKSRPYIILKWAQTADGFIDVIRNPSNSGQPNWITNEQARMLVHKWRSEEQSIMVGTNTAVLDNPNLNVRGWYGKNPVRLVIDRNLRLPRSLNLFNGIVPTLVFTQQNAETYKVNGTEFITLNFDAYLAENICKELYKRDINSVIIEGGARLLKTFIEAGLWDEARIFTGNIKFSEGIKAPGLENEPIFIENWKEFKLHIYKK